MRKGAATLQGKVYLADGKTPAWGARLAVLEPGYWSPVAVELTDALGLFA